MERSNDFLGTERVGRLMGRYAVPCVISLLVGALYNIVDQIFIANADYLGSYGNAANTVVFPLAVVALAIAVMVGDGCCAFVSMALDPVFGQEQYAQIPMAVVDIVMKFFQIVISVVVGMAAGCIPIVGYSVGAGRPDRARALFTRLLWAETCVGAAALLIAEAFPRPLIALFGAAQESTYYTDFAVKSFRIYLCMMVLACVNKACFIFLQAVGKALASTLLSMFREVVFGVGFALLLPVFFGLDGVLYSMPVSDILTFIISAIIIVKTYRELNVEGVQKV